MDYVEKMNSSMGMNGLLNIFIVLICIVFAWWALQELHLDKILKKPKSTQSKVLQILLAIALGYQVARFFIDYFLWSTWLSGMF
ncbi:DUF1146 family protein [Paenibacillus doosanensis]|uniref:DUF1146 domain-containing protein n=1 Tax=Paenibacillus konkukensis TaxID=2020716 RepID=A0ABY4RQJ2_9BACL|nr:MULTISPECIES: DUF1146 family protein [Paenibacillus]MCS7459984.1 DUF1146 family protein [Paenibacillus doosanensis]UQZ84428.1 hypothetical protein SK3146_03674 [Paenibacillus konkukensis]